MAMIEFEDRDQRSKEAFLAALQGCPPARAPYDWIAVAISLLLWLAHISMLVWLVRG